jgi:hypothetical protein
MQTIIITMQHNPVKVQEEIMIGESVGLSMLNSKTRGNGANLVVRRPVNNLVKKVFNYRTATAYNNLPVEVKQASSLMCFKRRINKYLGLH